VEELIETRRRLIGWIVVLMLPVHIGCNSRGGDPQTERSYRSKSEPPLTRPVSALTDNHEQKEAALEELKGPSQPKKSNVSQLSLDHLWNSTKRIVIRKSEVNDKIIYESNKKPDLRLLREVMQIMPPKPEAVPCRCVAAPVIELYYRKKYVGWIAVHDGVSIRTSLWNSDAEIADKERFLKWFDRRGMAGPRRRAIAEQNGVPRRPMIPAKQKVFLTE
jgi:hypothetical protein